MSPPYLTPTHPYHPVREKQELMLQRLKHVFSQSAHGTAGRMYNHHFTPLTHTLSSHQYPILYRQPRGSLFQGRWIINSDYCTRYNLDTPKQFLSPPTQEKKTPRKKQSVAKRYAPSALGLAHVLHFAHSYRAPSKGKTKPSPRRSAKKRPRANSRNRKQQKSSSSSSSSNSSSRSSGSSSESGSSESDSESGSESSEESSSSSSAPASKRLKYTDELDFVRKGT